MLANSNNNNNPAHAGQKPSTPTRPPPPTQGCIPMGSSGWERQRVLQGCPASGSELTLDYNPLEAGLSAAVSLDKGCYMGQETLAKVSNLNAIKQRLMGVQLDKEVQPGAVVMVVEEDGGRSKGGVVTSCTEGEDGTGGFAMGYIKAKVGVCVVVVFSRTEIGGKRFSNYITILLYVVCLRMSESHTTYHIEVYHIESHSMRHKTRGCWWMGCVVCWWSWNAPGGVWHRGHSLMRRRRILRMMMQRLQQKKRHGRHD